jgi:hypothetical protein
MFPISTVHNHVDASGAYAELMAQHLLGRSGTGVQMTHPPHIFFGQLGRSDSFASRLALLGHPIGHIVGVCPTEEMGGSPAGRIVTAMEDSNAFGDVAVHKLRYDAMYPAIPEDAVAVLISRAGPDPAFRRRVESGPQFLRQRHPLVCMSTRGRAKAHRARGHRAVAALDAGALAADQSRLRTHRVSPVPCAVPRGVAITAGVSCVNYTACLRG